MDRQASESAVRSHKSGGKTEQEPVVAMGTEMYKNLTMSCDATVHLLSHVKDERIKTSMTAALCYYEKKAGEVKKILCDHQAEAQEEGKMTRAMAHMGILMNTAIDTTDSHIAEMLIEGCTMSATEAVKLRNQYRDKPGCEELVSLADDIANFEQNNIESLKQYL